MLALELDADRSCAELAKTTLRAVLQSNEQMVTAQKVSVEGLLAAVVTAGPSFSTYAIRCRHTRQSTRNAALEIFCSAQNRFLCTDVLNICFVKMGTTAKVNHSRH